MKKDDFTHKDIARLYAKIKKTSDCWEWMACKFHFGHGVFRHKGKNLKAHRVMAALALGEVPSGLNVNHTCDNPSCVNPNHLYVGTQKEKVSIP